MPLMWGDARVDLIEVGPAHTDGDVLVHVPDAKTVYTGDILFIGWHAHRVGWPPEQLGRRICDLMLEMDVDTVVPGHGPLTDKGRRTRGTRLPLHLSTPRPPVGKQQALTPLTAARDIGAALAADERFSSWGEFGRIAVNVDTVYRSLDPQHSTPDVVEQFRRMAELESATPGHP